MPTSTDSTIDGLVASVRTRLIGARLLESMVWSAAATGASCLIAIAVAAWLGPSRWWRVAQLVAAATVAIAWIAVTLRARRRFQDQVTVAHLIAERVDGLGEELWCAVELTRDQAREDQHTSRALVEAQRERVAREIARRGLTSRTIVRLRPERNSARAMLVVVVIGGIAMLAAPSVMRRGLRAMLERPTRAVSRIPIVADLTATLTPPAYSGAPERKVPGLSGRLQVLPGTKIVLEARSLVANIATATLEVVEDGVTRHEPVTVDGDAKMRRLTTSFSVKKRSTYRFVLQSLAREPVTEPETRAVEPEVDRPPRVELITPADPLELAAPRPVELAYIVDDDYGADEIALVWKTGEGAEERRVLKMLERNDHARMATDKILWDTGELGLKPGVTVAYHVEARDYDDVLGPNVGKSRTAYLRLKNPREKQEKEIAAVETALELTLALLADRLESRGEPAALMARTTELVTTLRTLERKDKIIEHIQKIERLARERAPGAHYVPPLERVAIALDAMAGKQKLEELLAAGDDVKRAREALRKALDALKKNPSDEKLKRELQARMRELEQKMAAMREKAAKMASELPDQFINRDAVESRSMDAEMAQLKKDLESGDLAKAAAALDKLASSMDRMMSEMEEDLSGYRRERMSEEDKAMAALENDVRDLEKEERDLQQDTDALKQRYAEEDKAEAERAKKAMAELRKKAATLKREISEAAQDVRGPYDRGDLDKARERANSLERALEAGDLEQAKRFAFESDAVLQTLKESPSLRRAGKGSATARAQKTAAEIAEALNKASQRAERKVSPGDGNKLDELARRQAATRRRLGETKQRMSQSMPGQGSELGQMLDEAGREMERSTDRLGQRRPSEASEREGAALDKLSQLREQLSQQRRPQSEGGGADFSKEPVKIPGAEDWKAPREFREDVLEAMKKGAPKDYRELVRKYYEEIVK